MREVIPARLWVGNARDARNMKAVLTTGAEAVVDLAMEEPPLQPPREVIYCRFPLIDGDGNPPALLRTVVQTVARFLVTQVPTLVACGGGMSRSPAIVAAALAATSGAPLDQMLQKVSAGGPHDVSPAFWTALHDATETRLSTNASDPTPLKERPA